MATLLIETPDGPREYEPVESRLERFRKDANYQATRIVTSFQSRAAALGLPDAALSKFDADYLGKPIFIFRAELLNASGQVLASRHAMGELQNQKDFETLETTAVGRLLTALGFGSSGSAEKEAELSAVQSAFGPASTEPEPSERTASVKAHNGQTQTSAAPSATKTSVTSVAGVAIPLSPDQADGTKELEDPIPARLLPTVRAKHNQLVIEAQRRKEQPPAMPTTLKAAELMLMQFAEKHRRVGVAS